MILADYLKPYVCDQNYDRYTPREQASWRFIMRNAASFLQEHAHEAYLDGLGKAGISIDSIPDIAEMNRQLNKIGWSAVCVRGYIPPLVFLDFQSRKILPIAGNMRSLAHLIYTAAPDIVHEAAGHAPILADASYSEYLNLYAKLARKAIFSTADIRLYEAVRQLSDAKENPDFTSEMIAAAEAELRLAEAGLNWTSEASLVARMYWWTAEYGLVGSLEQPKIYGAGLLSSLSEGRNCITSAVKKIIFDIDCIEKSFDITEPQPQLYVAQSFDHLKKVLGQLEQKMAFFRGGVYGLEIAKKAGTVCTVVLNSGLEVSGIVDSFSKQADQIHFIRWAGPVQLAYDGKQLADQGRSRHPQGFSSPLGAWHSEAKPWSLGPEDLRSRGFVSDALVSIEFLNGYILKGKFLGALHQGKVLVYITLKDASLWDNESQQIYFPQWGEFDLVVGADVCSVYGGPADWASFGDYQAGSATTSPARQSPFSEEEKRIFEHYQRLCNIRGLIASSKSFSVEDIISELKSLSEKVQSQYWDDWLLAVEIHEILVGLLGVNPLSLSWLSDMLTTILQKQEALPDMTKFIRLGLGLVDPIYRNRV